MIDLKLEVPKQWTDSAPVKLAVRELEQELPRLFAGDVKLRIILKMGRPPKDWKLAPDRIAWKSDGRGKVEISGNHPRALLFAAYAWLESLGLHWLFPGVKGKHYPDIVRHAPKRGSHRSEAAFLHRGVATEGAFKGPDLILFIEWMARQRLNHVFLQFESCRIFYRRADPSVPEHLVRKWDRDAAVAIEQRGLIFEKVGHDWLNKTFKFNVTEFHDRRRPTAAQQKIMAQVDGRRGFVNDKPMFSQICLSAPGVKAGLRSYFVRYCRAHPDLDVIAFWVGDGLNNWCECDRCSKLSASDQYVDLINLLSETLHRINPRMKLEAICYTNFLEAPRNVRLLNRHNNVIFAFAPYARNLLKPLKSAPLSWTPPSTRNRIVFPPNGGYWNILSNWMGRVDTKRIYVFDYYFAEQWLNESFLSEIMRRDLLAYSKAGVGGMVSCQPIHQFFPHGANMAAMAKLLWNPRQSLKAIWRDYFKSHFGKIGGAQLMDVWVRQSRLLQQQEGDGKLCALKKRALTRFRFQHQALWKALRNDGDAISSHHHRAWMKYSDYWASVLRELGDSTNAAAKGRQISEAIRHALDSGQVPLPDLHKTARAAQVAIDGKL